MAKKMSRRQKKEQEAQKRREEQETVRREILLHAQGLAEEINLRLLAEEPALTGGQEVLFAESVAVTDICFPPEKKSRFLKPRKWAGTLLALLQNLLHIKSKKRKG